MMQLTNKKFIFIIAVLFIILFLYFSVKNSFSSKSVEVKKIDSISNYNYILHSNQSDIYKMEFKKLKEILEKPDVNTVEYEREVSKLFVIDFFTLDDKITNTDIGGLDFIHENMKSEFIKKARNTIYRNVQNNIYGDRKQELPLVKDVKITREQTIKYEKDNIKDENAYQVELDIEYEKDLKYKSSVVLTLIHENEKIYIVEVK